MAIETPPELRRHLQWALEVELSTIPPYLYAMYAIEDQSSEAAALIRSVAVEEMLHVALVANLLTAVGGRPRLHDPEIVRPFPRPLPHHQPPLELPLAEPTSDLVENVFLTIEQPAAVDGVPEDNDFETLGQFYLAIEDALERLDEQYPLFAEDRTSAGEAAAAAYQLSNPAYYRPVAFDVPESGGLHPIGDLEDAERAVETIVHQGEGLRDHRYADPAHREFTHYYKFQRIAAGAVEIGETRPVMTNPRTDTFRDTLQPISRLFNASFNYTLVLLERIFRTATSDLEERRVEDLYSLMNGVMSPLARTLTASPARADGRRHAGPTFEYYAFDSSHDPVAELRTLARDELADRPELGSVRDAVEDLAT